MSKEIFIQLGDDEWGNTLMRQKAFAAAAADPTRPLRVYVQEHAGWFLSYAFGAPEVRDGTVVESANDCAAWPAEVRAYWRRENEEWRRTQAAEDARRVEHMRRVFIEALTGGVA